MSFWYGEPRANPGDTFAGGVGSLADIYAAGLDQAKFVDNTNATQLALEEAVSRRIEEARQLTGATIDDPIRRAEADFRREALAPKPNPYSGAYNEPPRKKSYAEKLAPYMADFQRRLAEAARRVPDGSAERLTRSIEGDAVHIAREADARLATLMESRPGLGKWAATLAGGFSGSLRDPLQVATLAIGGGPGAGRTVAGRILSATAREMLVNGAAEAALQPPVQAWREKAGLEHGFDVGLRNTVFAALFGGLVGGAGQGVGEVFGRLTGRALDAGADAAAADARLPARTRAALAGDAAAAREMLPEIREALPPEARGALDHAELLDHAEAIRPATLSPEAHDVALTAAHRALDRERAPRFAPDPEQVSRVADALAGPEVRAAAPAGDAQSTLVEFLKDRGGVLDQGGDLSHVGAADLARKSSRKGRPDRRLTLDHAREAAAEAGYFDHLYGDPETAVARSTIGDLLEAIDGEKRGNPVYPRGEGPAFAPDADAAMARLEATVHEIAALAGPGVPDALLRRASDLVVREGVDAADALERAALAMEDAPEMRGGRTGEALPGWSDAELEAASAARGDEPFADPASPFDEPDRIGEDFSIAPADVELYGDVSMPGADGSPTTLAAFMERLAEDDEVISVVRACRAGG